MKRKGLVVVAFFVVMSYVACANEIKVVTESSVYSVPAEKVRHERLPDTYLSLLGLTIGKNSLSDIQRELGSASVRQRGEQQPYQVCYRSTSASDGTILIFGAGPLGGWKEITAVSLLSGNEQTADREACVPSTRVSKKLSTEAGLSLLLSQADLKARLGQPSKEENGKLIYLYETRETDSKTKSEWMINSTVEVIYHNGTMKRLSITKTESN